MEKKNNTLPNQIDDLLEEDFEEDDIKTSSESLSAINLMVNSFPRLTAEEEIRYGRMIQAGLKVDENDHSPEAYRIRNTGITARNTMIESNLRLVRNIAYQYANRGVMVQDLFQEGSIGLMEQVNRFNPELGFRFSTFVYQSIEQKIKRFVQAQHNDIRLPLNFQDKLSKIKGVQSYLIQELGQNPSALEIAICIQIGNTAFAQAVSEGTDLNELGRTLGFGDYNPAFITKALNTQGQVLSLDDVISEDDDRTLMDKIVDTDDSMNSLDLEILRDILTKMMGLLDERQATIIAYRYGLGGLPELTFEALGKMLGCTRERVRQIEKEAIGILQESQTSSLLFAFKG